MVWMHRDHAQGDRKADPLAGISVPVLPFDNLLGQMNQHPFGAIIPQFVKCPQHAQSEK